MRATRLRHSKLGSITIETLSSSLIEVPLIPLMPLPFLLYYRKEQLDAPKTLNSISDFPHSTATPEHRA